MKYLFLDMNYWVQMARGMNTHDTRWATVYSRLREAVEQAIVTIPLFAGHYLELWHRSDSTSREDVGRLMRDLSQYVTLLPIQDIQKLEIDAYLETKSGNPSQVTIENIIGRGVEHAFSSPQGRVRFVESLETPEDPESAPAEPPVEWDRLRSLLGSAGWEWFQLVGHPLFNGALGVDRTPEHRHGAKYAQREENFRKQLMSTPGMKTRLDDVVVLQEFNAALDLINDACESRGIDPYTLLLNGHEQNPPDGIREFVASVPTMNVFAKLRMQMHRDYSYPLKQHDRDDLVMLATTIPYCNWVITEKTWRHLSHVSCLSSRYHTEVGSDLGAIEDVVQRQL